MGETNRAPLYNSKGNSLIIKKKRDSGEKFGKKGFVKNLKDNYELYLFLLPAFVYFIVFRYWPMYGLQIAFRKFNGSLGIWGSPWVGLRNFTDFFNSYYFWVLIKNTIGITLYSILIGFPIPIIFALMLNEVDNERFKRFVQTVSYAPHFISTVVIVGIIIAFLSPTTGVINHIIVACGGETKPFMIMPGWFKSIYVWSGVWQSMGWSAIIYLAALSGIDPQQHEAAVIDGANRFERIWHINIPGILPTIIILLILNMGSIMNVGFEKIYLMQNPLNFEASDVISTYVYRTGLIDADFSFSTAVGLFNSVINFIILIIVNIISGKASEISLW
ncbi:MAG TPA: sugar ABC transporter permease [Clostridiaceae bacterium]|jgi:putative aldouronate transport system permease protein|nr:sugar ABC transporter permease [Clostridiaceae bacterium]